jgi:hypothetical protein
MEISLAAVCDTASERPDGKLDLVGIFNELRAPGFPAVQDAMTVVLAIAWSAHESGRQPIRADLIDEDEQLILTIQGHTEVPAPAANDAARPHTRLVMPLENVVFPHAGVYWLRLSAVGETRRTCSLFVGYAENGTD